MNTLFTWGFDIDYNVDSRCIYRENYSVIDYASRVNVEIEEWRVETLKDPRLSMMAQKCGAKFIFMLILLENHQKKHAEFLLACKTE